MRRTQKELQEEIEKFKVYQKDDRWYGYRECPDCKLQIQYSSIERFILLRTMRNLEKRFALCNSCNKKGTNNPFFGKTHTNQSNIKNSKNRTGKACGINNAMANPIHRKAVSEALKIKYKDGSLDHVKAIQRKNAYTNQANGKLNTTPISNAEKEIKFELEKSGFDVEGQFKIDNLKYDLLIKDKKTIIEYNGDYWHCNPNKYKTDYFNQKKQKFAHELWEQDRIKKELAEKSGYKLFTIWEQDYMFNKEKEIELIKQKINE